MKNRQKWQGIGIILGGSLLALVIAFAICGVFLALIGHNPFTVYRQMISYDISRDSFLDAMRRAVPLMLSGRPRDRGPIWSARRERSTACGSRRRWC